MKASYSHKTLANSEKDENNKEQFNANVCFTSLDAVPKKCNRSVCYNSVKVLQIFIKATP
jgi:hypothetical protein